MGRKSLILTSVALATLVLSGCAVTGNKTGDNTPVPTQTFDPNLIPSVPAEDALAVDPQIFVTELGDYIFRVGDGPTWCSVNPDDKFVVCEHNETDATYDQIEPPADCKLSYGYQIKLWDKAPTGSDAGFLCASSLYADPANAQSLNTGETLTIGNLTCFVQDVTVRCDNKRGHYVVLGPEVWALG